MFAKAGFKREIRCDFAGKAFDNSYKSCHNSEYFIVKNHFFSLFNKFCKYTSFQTSEITAYLTFETCDKIICELDLVGSSRL